MAEPLDAGAVQAHVVGGPAGTELLAAVNVSSIAGRAAWAGYAAYSMTKFGAKGFTEALRQEVTRKYVRVGVIEPGGVATELGSHNSGDALKGIEEFYASTEVLAPEDLADAVALTDADADGGDTPPSGGCHQAAGERAEDARAGRAERWPIAIAPP